MSDGTGGFAADEPEGSSSGSQYISAKDAKWIGIVLVVLIILFTPLYRHFKRKTDKAVCAENLGQIYKAVSLYAEQNNGLFPPPYVVGSGEAPYLHTDGRPITWGTLVQPFMVPRRNFRCPSSEDDEVVNASHPTEVATPVPMSYGIFGPIAAKALDRIPNPNTTALISETSNHGTHGTANPSPLLDAVGTASAFDGFLIGFDTGNQKPNERTEYVTRLAFYGSAGGKFAQEGEARHDEGIHILYADGQLGTIKPNQARVQRLGTNELIGLWATRD